MILQTFDDGELKSVVRGKINDNFQIIEELFPSSNDFVATADIDSGTISSKTLNSITDATKNWAVGSLVGKVVKLSTSTGEDDYAIIISNSSTVLIFDDNHLNYNFSTYRILSTFTASQTNSIISFNITTNDCAFILPSVSTLDNRTSLFLYNEVANNGDYGTVIVCFGNDRQRGKKWGILEHRYEGIKVVSHNTDTPHWDILQLENIKRFGNVFINNDVPVTSVSYVPVLTSLNSELLSSKRFDYVTVGSNTWLKYKSIISAHFRGSGNLTITRSGGGNSTVLIKIRIKKFATGVTVDSDTYSKVRFSGDSTQTVPFSLPVFLEPNDEMTLVIQRDAGTVIIEGGSTISFTEL